MSTRTPPHRTHGVTKVMALLTAVGLTAISRLVAQGWDASGTSVRDLPLHEVPVSARGHELVFLITGDGGYAPGDRGIADTFAAQGIPVVALNARSYLGKRRIPDEAANDAARIMRHYLAVWNRDSLVFVGYSRGADMAPFIVTRLPADLRSRISVMVMIGLAERASFEFHWADLVKDIKRSTDYPVAPEVMKVHDVRMLCLYGTDEHDSLCPTFPPAVLRVDLHGGRHALSRDEGADAARRILREISSGPG